MKARLDDRQQRWAYAGAAVAAVGFVVANVADYPKAVPYTITGLAMATILAVGAYRRSVVLTGGAAFLISFGPWAGLWFMGAPFIAWGGLLMYRASKEAAGAKEPPAPAEKAVKKAEAKKAEAKKAAPGKSKRYTPPKP